MLNEKVLAHAAMNQHLSVDESLVSHFDKAWCKAVFERKTNSYGYKIWCLCEPLGYLMQYKTLSEETSQSLLFRA